MRYDNDEYFYYVIDNIDEEYLPESLYSKIYPRLYAYVNDLYFLNVSVDKASWLVNLLLIRFKTDLHE